MLRKIFILIFTFVGLTFAFERNITLSEYLEEAQKALKIAYENGAHVKAQYEYGKASFGIL